MKEMTYMDQILNESRLVSPLGISFKKCTEEYKLTGSDGIVCRVQPEKNLDIHSGFTQRSSILKRF